MSLFCLFIYASLYPFFTGLFELFWVGVGVFLFFLPSFFLSLLCFRFLLFFLIFLCSLLSIIKHFCFYFLISFFIFSSYFSISKRSLQKTRQGRRKRKKKEGRKKTRKKEEKGERREKKEKEERREGKSNVMKKPKRNNEYVTISKWKMKEMKMIANKLNCWHEK